MQSEQSKKVMAPLCYRKWLHSSLVLSQPSRKTLEPGYLMDLFSFNILTPTITLHRNLRIRN